jgi:DNA-binding LytR/AlgR family response regulator
MEKKSCLLVDDDPLFAKLIEEYCEKIPYVYIAKTCTTYAETVSALTASTVDFILLDIRLKDPHELTGFDLLRTVPKLPPVVIVTSSPEYAIESYAIGSPVDFLLKPFDFNRFLVAVNRALNIITKNEQLIDDHFVFLKIGRRFQRFHIEEIDYVEAYGIYTKVIVNGVPHVVNDTISNLEDSLSVKKFIRVHKSYIVSLNKVVGFDHNKLYLKNGAVPIGISYKPKLQGFLRLFGNDDTPSSNK